MDSSSVRDIFLVVSSPAVFDPITFLRWTEGKSEEEVARERIEMLRSGKMAAPFTMARERRLGDSEAYREFATNLQSEWGTLIRHEIYDHYRNYHLLEHFLYQPNLLQDGQHLLQIPEDIQAFIVEKYWALDDVVVREVIVKRLTKSRKDLDDVSEATGLNLRRITRQFENIRRIYIGIEEDQKFECNLVEYCHSFGLSGLLTRKYACTVFLLVSKFNLLNNKRIQRTTSEGLLLCAALILGCLAPDTDFFYQATKAVASAVISQRMTSSLLEQQPSYNLMPSTSMSSSSSSSSSLTTSLSASPMKTESIPIPIPNSATSGSSPHSPVSPTSHVPPPTHIPIDSSVAKLLPGSRVSLQPSEKIQTQNLIFPTGGGNVDDDTCESLLLNDDELCWHVVWNVFERVDSMELDKGLLSNLRDVRNVLTGEALDSGCLFVKKALEERGSLGLGSGVNPNGGSSVSSSLKRLTNDVTKIRTLLKALMQIGANLSQTREYRDIFEDLITKVLEPLEDMGLSPAEIQTVLICCYFVVRPLPGVNTNSTPTPTPRSSVNVSDSVSGSMRKVSVDKGKRLGKDWLRFVTCCRLIIFYLVREG